MNTSTRRTEFAKQSTVALALWVSIVCSNDDPGMTIAYFTVRSNLGFSIKKRKIVDSSETIDTYNNFVNESEYLRSCHLNMKIKTCLSQKPLSHLNKIYT